MRTSRLPLLVMFLAACDSSPSGDDGSGGTMGAATEGGSATEGDSAAGGDAPTAGDDADGSDSASGPACGNGALDPGEVCDGTRGLDDNSCSALGYVAGTLGCAADCASFDDSGCSDSAICGDGEVSEGEACEVDVTAAMSCGAAGAGEQSCLDCTWSVASCCSATCADGCDDTCGADPADLTGTWTFSFFNNGWEGPDPTMVMELAQDGDTLSGSFTTDAWYLGDQEFEGGTRTGNDIYLHVPITQLQDGMIMEGTVCGGCRMQGVTDPQGGLNSDWVATRSR